MDASRNQTNVRTSGSRRTLRKECRISQRPVHLAVEHRLKVDEIVQWVAHCLPLFLKQVPGRSEADDHFAQIG